MKLFERLYLVINFYIFAELYLNIDINSKCLINKLFQFQPDSRRVPLKKRKHVLEILDYREEEPIFIENFAGSTSSSITPEATPSIYTPPQTPPKPLNCVQYPPYVPVEAEINAKRWLPSPAMSISPFLPDDLQSPISPQAVSPMPDIAPKRKSKTKKKKKSPIFIYSINGKPLNKTTKSNLLKLDFMKSEIEIDDLDVSDTFDDILSKKSPTHRGKESKAKSSTSNGLMNHSPRSPFEPVEETEPKPANNYRCRFCYNYSLTNGNNGQPYVCQYESCPSNQHESNRKPQTFHGREPHRSTQEVINISHEAEVREIEWTPQSSQSQIHRTPQSPPMNQPPQPYMPQLTQPMSPWHLNFNHSPTPQMMANKFCRKDEIDFVNQFRRGYPEDQKSLYLPNNFQSHFNQ